MTWKMTSLCAIIAIRYLWVNHFFKIIENGILMKMDICLADFVTNTFQTTQNFASTLTQSISQWIAKIAIRLLSILPHCQGSHLPHALKLGLSEKHTKFEKNLPHGFDKSADLLSKRQNHEEDFFKLCVLLKKFKLYYVRHLWQINGRGKKYLLAVIQL